jgi:hypothetical protein
MNLRPKKGGTPRPFGCGTFIKEYLMEAGPNGAPQAQIFRSYKEALINAIASDRGIGEEERLAKRQKRPIDPDNVEKLIQKHLAHTPYKSTGCRYHSFITYFSNLQRLGWVEFSGIEEPSAMQDNYPKGQALRYYRLTSAGMSAPDYLWLNPRAALYG